MKLIIYLFNLDERTRREYKAFPMNSVWKPKTGDVGRRERADVPLSRSETSVTPDEKRPATRASASAVSDGLSTTAITFLSAVKPFSAITSVNRPKSSMAVRRVSARYRNGGPPGDGWYDGRFRHAGNNECRVPEQTRRWEIRHLAIGRDNAAEGRPSRSKIKMTLQERAPPAIERRTHGALWHARYCRRRDNG